ncbi:MBG domain-containing protein [Pedobacter cryoconitis]|uniref:MBG domain-containing protein n=1 Tax=Pedobacter cryoconitis TaxID=188932 RepID=A0A7X0MKY7_9SPHI|nr:MBG domain-containing protein [Pedobacter cryoconitis]MBB6502546.1 hypothetical protein [Pedobacter cryoconitis]
MKRLLLFILTLFSIQVSGQVPKLEMLIFPKYIEGSTGSRGELRAGIPYVYRARITGLKAGKTYRYENKIVNDVLGTTTSPKYMFILPPVNVKPGTPGYSSGDFFMPPITTDDTNGSSELGKLSSDYGVLTADASGTYAGWFIQETVKGTIGEVFLRVSLNDPEGADPAAIAYMVHSPEDQPLKVLGVAAKDNEEDDPKFATAIRSTPAAGGIAKNFVFLYDNEAGTGRPVAGTFIENDGVSSAAASGVSGLAAFYFNHVNGVNGTWGTMLVNTDANGIRRIEQRSLTDGSITGYNISSDGVWPDGANSGQTVSTVQTRLGGNAAGTVSIVLDGSKVTLAMPKSPQQVTFTNTFPATFKVGDPDFTLTASSTAGLSAFQYTVAPAGILELNGSKVKIIGGGTAVITVTEPGNIVTDAGTATKSITVTATAQTIAGLPATFTKVYGDANIVLTATGGASGNPVIYTSDNPAIASVENGNQVMLRKSGTVVIRANQAGGANYAPATEVTSTLTIAKAVLDVIAADKIKTQGSLNPAATFTYGVFKNSDDATVITGAPVLTIQADAASPAGIYDINVDVSGLGSDQYSFNPVKGKLTVESKKEQVITFSGFPVSAVYGSQPLAFQVTSNSTNEIIFNSSNPNVALVEKNAAGEWVVKVIGAGEADITASQTEDGVFGPGLLSQHISVSKIALSVIADNKSKLTGQADPVFTARFEGFVNQDDVSKLSGALVFTKQADGNDFLIVPSGLSSTDYTITFVNGRLTEGNIAFASMNKTYGDAAFDPAAMSLGKEPIYSVANPAVAIVNATGLLEIKGTGTTVVTATFGPGIIGTAILKVDQKPVTITANPQTRGYNQTNPLLTVSYAGLAYGETENVLSVKPQVSTTASINTNAGIYPISVTGAVASNYRFSYQQGVLTVTKTPLTVKVIDVAKSYGQEIPELILSYTGLASQDNAIDLNLKTVVSTTVTRSSGVGIYPVNVSGLTVTSNYIVSYLPGTFNVTPAALTIKADNAERGVGQPDPVFTITYTGFVNGDQSSVLIDKPVVVTTATAGSGKGIYPINVSAATASNYTISYIAGQLSIKSVPSVVYPDLPVVSYGDASFNPAVTADSGLQPTYASDNLTVAVIENGRVKIVGSGTVNITASFAATTGFTAVVVSKSLIVNKRMLIVRADNKTRLYGQSNPVLTATYDGFVNGETLVTAIAAPALLTTTANPLSPAGTYSISGNSASAQNYTFSYETGILAVDKAVLTVTADHKTRIFGADNPVLTFKYSGFVNAEGQNVIQNPPLASTLAVQNSPAGVYPIILSGASAGNYSFNYISGNLTITSTTRTITFDPIASKFVGDTDFVPNVTLTSGETPVLSSADPAVAIIKDNKIHLTGVGNVFITATAPANPNYATTPSATRLLLVSKVAQTITFESIPVLQLNGVYSLKAVSSAGLPVTFKVANPDLVSLTGNDLKGLRIGKTQITAVQLGNDRYAAAEFSVQDVQIADAIGDGLRVHPALSINGDGVNEFLSIDGIKDFPLNKVTIINRNGLKVFDVEGYDNDQHVFVGKSKSGEALPQGTYFCLIEYQTDSKVKSKTGYFILKY